MLHPKQKNEKRQYPRLQKNLPIKIKSDDFDIVTETKNISGIGAFCKIDRYISAFTKLNISILIPNKHPQKPPIAVNCKGVVVRVERNENGLETQYNIAIYFNEISKQNILKINRYVNDQLKNSEKFQKI